MSLSDCVKCWDTPCSCGWEWREHSIEYLEDRIRLFKKIIEFKKTNPNMKFSKYGDGVKGVTEDEKALMELLRGDRCEAKEGP